MRAMGNPTIKHNHSLEEDQCDRVCSGGALTHTHTHTHTHFDSVEMLPCTSPGLWSFTPSHTHTWQTYTANSWSVMVHVGLFSSPVDPLSPSPYCSTHKPLSSRPHQSGTTCCDLIRAGWPMMTSSKQDAPWAQRLTACT